MNPFICSAVIMPLTNCRYLIG
uniref:Uncharacterized protein n=1 Tax=Anguilla anguilla TaxID=7936 RepID=A0A0E9Q0P2_ANGAN